MKTKDLIINAVASLRGHLFAYHYDDYRKKARSHIFPCISDERILDDIEAIQQREDVQNELKRQFHFLLYHKVKNYKDGAIVLFSTDFSVDSYTKAIINKAFVEAELARYNDIKTEIEKSKVLVDNYLKEWK